MKRLTLLFITMMVACSLFAQDIIGQWNGLLKVQGTQLRIVFNISKTDAGYTSTMDSPDQGAKGIKVSATTFENSILKLDVAMGGIHYEGTFNQEHQFVGEFKQGTFTCPLNLAREVQAKVVLSKPQDPVMPYPYYTEEVKFDNTDANVTLAGTLSLPSKEGKFPVVVLITGSGPQNRNEELMGHKPFLVLADHLTKNGIAVLRYDDRGTYESTGDFSKANTLDLASDVKAAIKYLLTRKEIDKKKIGLIGHSEGGIIAPMVAAESKDVNYIVLMAGTGIPGRDLLLLQGELIGKAMGLTDEKLQKAKTINKGAFDIIGNSTDTAAIKKELTTYLLPIIKETPSSEKPAGLSDEDLVKQQIAQLTSPWLQFFLKYDPALILRKVKCPVLALNGSKDLQVPPRENLSAIKSGLEKGGNKNITVREFPNLNHLFQECTTGAPSEYGEIQQTISPQVLNEMSNWILRQTK
jgi:uncharacterized protein